MIAKVFFNHVEDALCFKCVRDVLKTTIFSLVLAGLCKQYVKDFADGKVPCVESTLQQIVKERNEEAKRKALGLYNSG